MNKNKLIVGAVVLGIVVVAIIGLRQTPLGGTFVSEQTFGGGIKTAYINAFQGTLITASKTLTTNELSRSSVFPVGKASTTIALTLPAVSADMVGREVKFITTVASTGVNMAYTSLMTTVTQSNNSTFGTAEDIGDYISCIFISTSKARCDINAAD